MVASPQVAMYSAGAVFLVGAALATGALLQNGDSAHRQRTGGAGLELFPWHGAKLTADELAAAKSVAKPAKTIPATVAGDLPSHLPYRVGLYPRRVAAHVGQRKLLMSEVDFLTDFARRGDTVVYAGSAPGIHIPYLASLFDSLHLTFELYDPREFDLPKWEGRVIPRINTHQGFFTDETAAEYAGRDDVLFISDIRTGGHEAGLPGEEDVSRDMHQQEKWVLAMQPRAFMLKFRLEYFKEGIRDFEYLDGEARIQAWAPPASSETRLVAERPPGGYKRRKYDQAKYDRQMFYANSILREWGSFDVGVSPSAAKGVDTCFDCALEAHMWRKFLGEAATPAKLAQMFNDTSRALQRPLLKPPHGLEPEVPMTEKRERVVVHARPRRNIPSGGDPRGERRT